MSIFVIWVYFFKSLFYYLLVAAYVYQITALGSFCLRPGGPSHIFLSENEYINIFEAWRAASSSGPPENKAWTVGIAGTASSAVCQCQTAIQRSNAPNPFPPVPVTQALSHLPGHREVKELIHTNFYNEWKVQDGDTE